MKQQPSDLSRRSLLKALTVGSVAGAAIAATGISVAQANESSTVTEKKSNGYHETAHITSYYDSLRS
ncbi:twin-arginine translocation signal domain-containing protein [Shewanella putrefaciens]|uniref:Twin-arginine translocation signal domain-containing protein n=1 Tax=Shewanella putrefaciens TaxID=24 RepID=A0ABX8XBT6_SHEPU|nr:twin-arginine translocation signal domain-containing protein [Shewanella putrefaciens]AVV84764.1 formate dehydrogenase [Shewanella putrefaciens]MCT8944033.1 twin-arginine translocation signal domain-containing protein [Shewanella putrefaciens]QSE49268.1 twin-arginine translocation signal domain-containing protein [Shewanella putrefaciens]QYX72676.1 twin-arginine translocation signal domain-containing protein [Shewanella putrefaciens]GGN25628.1 Fnr-inducible formate dehydrogenase accessory p